MRVERSPRRRLRRSGKRVTTPPAQGRAPLPHGAAHCVLVDSMGGTDSRFADAREAALDTGLEKKRWLQLSRSEAEIALMRTLKSAFDPRGVLNPGRVI